MVCRLESVEPCTITRHATSFPVLRKRGQVCNIYMADDWWLSHRLLMVTAFWSLLFVLGSPSHQSPLPIKCTYKHGSHAHNCWYQLLKHLRKITGHVSNAYKCFRWFLGRTILKWIFRIVYYSRITVHSYIIYLYHSK